MDVYCFKGRFPGWTLSLFKCKIFSVHSYQKGFCLENHFDKYWHHFLPFLTTSFICFEQKIYPPCFFHPPIMFHEEILDLPRLLQSLRLFRICGNSNVIFQNVLFKLKCNVPTCWAKLKNSQHCHEKLKFDVDLSFLVLFLEETLNVVVFYLKYFNSIFGG